MGGAAFFRYVLIRGEQKKPIEDIKGIRIGACDCCAPNAARLVKEVVQALFSSTLRKSYFPPFLRIIEIHPFRVELVRSVRAAASRLAFGPVNGFLIFFMIGIAENFHNPIITWHSPAVFWWTSAFAGDTSRIFYALVLQKNSFKQHLVFPPIAKVIFIDSDDAGFDEMLDDADFPTRQGVGFVPLIVRYADIESSLFVRLAKTKHVKGSATATYKSQKEYVAGT